MENNGGPGQSSNSLMNTNGEEGGPAKEHSSGRPPLPKQLSIPGSLASSRTSSPRNPSAQPSMQALSTLKLAQYKAGAKTFKEEAEPRAGLSSGDVVAFHSQEGLYAVLPLEAETDEPTVVHYAFSSSDSRSASDTATHLEVVKQGKWLAFRSAASGDRFLQARKRSPHRLVFFNTNIGTWEQWEVVEGDMDEAPWAHQSVTLKHRRLPQFELRVELVRVGTFTLRGPSTSITPRSITTAPQGADLSENVQLRKMSGVLMHEWFNFVDREKQLRMNIAAQVIQLVEDAADLKAWTLSQVDSIRGEMDEEVTQLLGVIQHKSTKLEDTTARLTNRLRWGIAVLQAKNELGIKRQVFSWWRGMASRKRYCGHVVAKLQQRADLRHAGRAFHCWLQHYQEQQARQQRLYQAVRRMAFVKTYHAFVSWRELVAAKKEVALHYHHLTVSAWSHMQTWRMQQAFAAWRDHASRCGHGRALLVRMAGKAQQRLVATTVTAWRQFVQQQQARVDSLAALVAARQRHAALQQALSCWREAVDAKHGRRMQLTHARHLLGRLRQQHALRAWRAWHTHRAEREHAWLQLLRNLQLRRQQHAFVAWQEEAAYRRDRREMLMRFVHDRAMGMMQQAFEAWRAHTATKRHQAFGLEQAVVRVSNRLLASAWVSWCDHVADAKVQRHRIAVCQRRHQAAMLRAALSTWREWAGMKRTEKQIVQQGLKRSNRSRLTAVFRALAANVEHANAKRVQIEAAVQLYSTQLRSRALAAWVEAPHARRRFEQHLQAIHKSMQVLTIRAVLQGWRAATQASIAGQQKVVHAQHLLGKLRLRTAFQAWRGYCSCREHLQVQLETAVLRRAEQLSGSAFGGWREYVAAKRDSAMRMMECTMRISQLRMAWAFQAWRQAAAERAAAKQAMQGTQRRFRRFKAAAAFRAWRRHAESMVEAHLAADQMAAARAGAAVHQCFAAWAAFAGHQAEQKAAVVNFVHRRASWMMANVLNVWQHFLEHKAARRAQLQRARRKLVRVRLQQAFWAWQQHAEERRACSFLHQAVEKKLQAKRLARCFRAWAEHTAHMHHVRQVAGALARRAHQTQLAAALHCWQDVATMRRHARLMLGKLARRSDGQLLASTLQAWRQQVHRAQHLQRLESNMGAKRQLSMLGAAFQGWRQHSANIYAVRAAVNDRHHAEARMLLRLALRSWQKHTSQRQLHRAHVLEVCVGKQVASLQSNAFSAWRQYTQARQRAQAVMHRAVDRLVMRITRTAFEAWREAARARKARRTALARFMQRWQQQRMRAVFWQWQAALQERKAALDNLRRCLIRKRVAFTLFRNWYWESFDDEVQETLRTMFEITNEAAADPLPSRAGSPVSSLLSSPIRAQLGYGASHQHQQLAAGVAQRLAQPGSLQPAYMRQGLHPPEGQLPEGGITASMHLHFGSASAGAIMRQPLPLQPAPLHDRVASAHSSPVKPSHAFVPAPAPNLGGTVLAPFRDYAAGSLTHGMPTSGCASQQVAAGQLAVGYANPSPRQQEQAGSSPGLQGAGSSIASGSKGASTIAPRSPLTPSSAGYAGGTPMTHFATPNPDGMFTIDRVPGTASAMQARRDMHSMADQQQHHSPYGSSVAHASPGGLTGLRLTPSPGGPAFSPLSGQQHSPGAASDALTPGMSRTRVWGAGASQQTPLNQARTPQPVLGDASLGAFVDEATPDPALQGYAISPGLLQQLADAATPPAGMTGGWYQLKHMSASGGLQSGPQTVFQTPQGSFKTPPPGFPELQGDYSIRRLSTAAEYEAQDMQAQGTPNPDDFIAAYPGGRNGGVFNSEEQLSAAKTPFYHINPMCFDSPTRQRLGGLD